MAIDVADVVAQYGAYYKPGSDNQQNLRNMIYKPSETAALFAARPTEDTIYRGTLASLDRVVQPFQKGFTPISTITFQPNQFSLFRPKIDLKETPDDLEATYLGFLTALPTNERAAWPFVRWWLENHVMARKEQDLETSEYFTGVYAAPVADVPGAAGTAMDGLRKIIRGYNTGGRTNLGNGAIATGAPAGDDVDFCTQVEEFVAELPTHFRKKVDLVVMSPENELKYKRGKRKKYGLQVNFLTGQGVSDLLTIEDFPNASIKGLESHAGSNLMWTTIAANRIRPQKKAALKDTMAVKEFAPRVVSAYTDWWEVLNFEVPEFLFHNDQDLA
ncbi:MAG: hypothetical protein JO301_16940 [Chitinophagaceae bacterium]|nr:hypothetical protein [Chitinophagaceae bacterium]